MKDHFSSLSGLYARFRPSYPKEMFDFLSSITVEHDAAWDCGAGSGQIAYDLAERFRTVAATDISEHQLRNAAPKQNIVCSVQQAEHSSFRDGSFDLITVAQAIHWFTFDAFYREAERTLKPEGIIAVIGYSLLKIEPEIDAVITRFHDLVVGPYWDPERKYVDDEYRSIPFPFNEISAPGFTSIHSWTIEHLIGYLHTWSAVKAYKTATGSDPVEKISPPLLIISS